MTFVARGIACTVLASCLLAPPLRADNMVSGNLVITQPWSSATPGGAKVAGGYLTIENRGAAPDRLLSGSTTVAQRIEMHEMAINNGVMTMRPVENGLIVEPGKTVKFAPGGHHLMFLDLKAPFKQGEQVPVMLRFEHAGEIKAMFEVQGMGAQAPGPVGDSEPRKPAATTAAADADESFFTHCTPIGRWPTSPFRPTALALSRS